MSRDSINVHPESDLRSLEAEANLTKPLAKPMLVLFLACLLVGLFCCKLNLQLYQHQAPFYDSLSYNDRLFRVMTKAREVSFTESLKAACNANSTNCFPFIVAAVIAPLVEPSRLVGIWIQVGLLYFFLVSLFYYLSRVRRLSESSSVAACLAFLAIKCLYFDNGGLSDFRMDLSLFLGCAVTSVWFLTSMATGKKRHFVLMGIAASVCCLSRATAPIYLVFALAPLFAVELFKRSQRIEKIAGVIWATCVVVLLSGWFYALNFEYLKYYYFDWNTDANAKIPLVEALNHWKYAQRSVGGPFALMIICWGTAVLVRTSKNSINFQLDLRSGSQSGNRLATRLASRQCGRANDWAKSGLESICGDAGGIRNRLVFYAADPQTDGSPELQRAENVLLGSPDRLHLDRLVKRLEPTFS